jgi:hypothetical protein
MSSGSLVSSTGMVAVEECERERGRRNGCHLWTVTVFEQGWAYAIPHLKLPKVELGFVFNDICKVLYDNETVVRLCTVQETELIGAERLKARPEITPRNNHQVGMNLNGMPQQGNEQLYPRNSCLPSEQL